MRWRIFQLLEGSGCDKEKVSSEMIQVLQGNLNNIILLDSGFLITLMFIRYDPETFLNLRVIEKYYVWILYKRFRRDFYHEVDQGIILEVSGWGIHTDC